MYSTASVTDVKVLGSCVMLALPLWLFVAPAPPLFFFYRRLLWVS